MSNLRAQGAVEYLVILAMVLVIAVVVVSLLGLYPGQGGEMRGNEQSSYWNSAQPFGIRDTQQAGQASITLVLVNHAPRPLTLVSVNLTLSPGVWFSNYTRAEFNPGESRTIIITGNANMPDCTARSARAFSYSVSIIYDDDPLKGKLQPGSLQLSVNCR